MRSGALLNGFRNLSVIASRGLEDAYLLSVAAHFDRRLQAEGTPSRFASSHAQVSPSSSSERRKSTKFRAKRDKRSSPDNHADSRPAGPAIAKMFVAGGPSSDIPSKKRKSPTTSVSNAGQDEPSPLQSRQDHKEGLTTGELASIRKGDGAKNNQGSLAPRKVSNSPGSTPPASSQLHCHNDLTIVRTISAKSGAPPPSELMKALKDKTSLLKEWGVNWRPEEMNRIFNRLGEAWITKTRITELETQFLQLERAYEISGKDVGKMVSRNPDILGQSVDRSLRKMESFFMTGLGYKRGEMSKLLCKNPEILSYEYNYMPKAVHFLRNELGIAKQFLRALIDRHPTILKTGFETDTFQSNFAFVAKAALGRNFSVRRLKVIPMLTHEDKCLVSKILVAEPKLMTMEDLPAVRKLFQDLGLQEWEVSKLCVKYPQIFPDATTLDLDRKIAFLMELCGRNLEEIFRYGWILYKPLDEMYARFGFLECLLLDQRTWGFKEIMGGGPADFCKRITLTPVGAYTTFARNYVPKKEWTECNTLRSRMQPDEKASSAVS